MQLRWPLAAPRKITQRFGENPAYYAKWGLGGHEGLDLSCVTGTPVYAAHDGTVRHLSAPTSYGQYILLQGAGVTTLYGHLATYQAADGASVKAGQTIALSGNTGVVTGAHLHFGVKIAGVPNAAFKDWLDPLQYLTDAVAPQPDRRVRCSVMAQRIEPHLNASLVSLGAQWAKLVNPPTGARPLPGVPNLIVRMWTDDIDGQYLQAGQQGGRAFVRRMLPEWLKRPWATCYQLWNEPECNTNDGIARLADATLGAMYEADQVGIKLLVLNWAEGNPHDNATGDPSVTAWKVKQFSTVIKEAIKRGHYVGRHAYWRPNVEGPLGQYHALGRVVQDVQWWREAGVPVDSGLKLIIGETGIDGGIGGHDETARQGWRILSNLPAYTAQVVELEREARRYPWLEAYELFVDGWEPPWESFNHGPDGLRAIADGIRPLSTETGGAMIELGALREAVWNAGGIPYNPDAALPRYAREHQLGAPLTGEVDVAGYRAQGFALGIAYCRIGDWAHIQHIAW